MKIVILIKASTCIACGAFESIWKDVLEIIRGVNSQEFYVDDPNPEFPEFISNFFNVWYPFIFLIDSEDYDLLKNGSLRFHQIYNRVRIFNSSIHHGTLTSYPAIRITPDNVANWIMTTQLPKIQHKPKSRGQSVPVKEYMNVTGPGGKKMTFYTNDGRIFLRKFPDENGNKNE